MGMGGDRECVRIQSTTDSNDDRGGGSGVRKRGVDDEGEDRFSGHGVARRCNLTPGLGKERAARLSTDRRGPLGRNGLVHTVVGSSRFKYQHATPASIVRRQTHAGHRLSESLE